MIKNNITKKQEKIIKKIILKIVKFNNNNIIINDISKKEQYYQFTYITEEKVEKTEILELFLLKECSINSIIAKIAAKTIKQSQDDEFLNIKGLNLKLNKKDALLFSDIEKEYFIELWQSISKNKLIKFLENLI